MEILDSKFEQNNLTDNQIGEVHLFTLLKTPLIKDVAVFFDAKHLCVSSTGINDDSSATVTG